MIGLFGFSEALIQIQDVQFAASVKQKVDKIRPHMSDVIHYFPLTIQTSLMGIFIGALPGTGGDIAALFAYDHAKRVTKNPKVPFGQGAVEGLVAPESANNAAVPAAYIPMLAFGVPGDSPFHPDSDHHGSVCGGILRDQQQHRGCFPDGGLRNHRLFSPPP
ncbi:tripartite tricarboxylate transporter permease [Cuneatibacter sp. NSJ-177]|nr:tripartite tricarboxylate transporter permease [Cuneatibacter sp. NSJ-177]